MNPSRRSFFQGLIATPAIIKIPGLLMPVKPFPYLTLQDYTDRILKPFYKAYTELYTDTILYGVGGMEINFEGLVPTYTSIPAPVWRKFNLGET